MSWTITPASELATQGARWTELNDAAYRSPLLQLDFLLPALAEFGTGQELLATYVRDGQVLAMAVVAQRRQGRWETFQPSQAPLSFWMQRPGTEVGTLIDELMRALPGLPLIFDLPQRDPDLSPRPPDSGTLRTLDYVQTARVTVKGSFEEYWQARGKNLRNNLKKQRSKLAKEGVATRLQISRDPADVVEAIAAFGRLESAGWKAKEGTAIHADNAQGRFYTALLQRFCARGAGSIYRYFFGDKLVAMDLCIEGDGSIIFLKTTYDEEVPAIFSPALLMREESFTLLFGEGKFDRIEFYGKAMEWQLKWTDELRAMYHVTAYRWALLRGLQQIKLNPAQLLGQLRSGTPKRVAQTDNTPT